MNVEHRGRLPENIHVRPFQAGDICMLLEPTKKGEIERLAQQQMALQAKFGGTPIENVHLTCQRFACEDETHITGFVQRLTEALTHTAPFALTAIALQPLYVSALECYVLKWEIQIIEALQRFVELVKRLLVESGISSLYAPDFVSSGVSVLKDLPEPVWAQLGAPSPLFTVNRVQLSKILAPNEFEILATIDLSESS